MLKDKRILITQPLIRGFNGSTLVTLELAKELKRLGAKTTVYTCDYAEPAKAHFIKNHIKVNSAQENPQYKLSDFDYIWVHSQILPLSIVRQLAHKLPLKMPAFVFLHMSGMDWIPDEKPWIYDLENKLSSLSLFISEEVKAVNEPFLNRTISTAFFRNPTPIEYQTRQTAPHSKLKNLLIVSNHPPAEVQKAKSILTDKYKISVNSLGENSEEYELFDKSILEKYDAVLTIAKTVPYCLVSGTPVYVYDIYGGGPGWLNKQNFKDAKIRNFSGYQNERYPDYEGGVFHRKTAEKIADEIVTGYQDSLAYHQTSQKSFLEDFSIDLVLPKIFSKIQPQKISTFTKKYAESVLAAEQFATIKFEIGGLLYIRDDHIHNLEKRQKDLLKENAELSSIKSDFDQITSSRAYKLFDKAIAPYKKLKGRSQNAN